MYSIPTISCLQRWSFCAVARRRRISKAKGQPAKPGPKLLFLRDIPHCHNVTSTWFKPIQGTEVLMRQIPRLCQYFRVRAASKSLNNQPDAGEEKRSVRPLQKHKSQGLFHVHTWIFPWSYYTKVREILVFTNVYWKKRSHGSQVDVVSPFLHSPLDCHVIYMFVIFWKSHTVYQIPLHRPTHILPECLLEDQCRCIINSICISPMTCHKC